MSSDEPESSKPAEQAENQSAKDQTAKDQTAKDQTAKDQVPSPAEPPVVAQPEVTTHWSHENSDRQASTGTAQLLKEPGFLHPSSILFDVASHLRRFLFPALIALWSAARGGTWGLGIALILFSMALLGTIFRYITLRYRIDGSDFVVTEGLIFRRVRSVPVRRVQNVDLVQNPLHRLFGVAEVRIETASGTEPEATLRVLTHAQIEELRRALFAGEPPPAATQPTMSLHEQSTASEGEVKTSGREAVATNATVANGAGILLHATPLKLLVAAGLASNRGLVLLGVVVGLLLQNRSIEDSMFADWIADSWERMTETAEQSLSTSNGYASWALAAIAVFVVVTIVLRLVGIAWYVLRFYDHRLERHGNDLRLSCGLFTRVSATVPRKRVQFISIHRPLFFRWMKLASIRIETAGGGGKENEDATATVSRRWFLPVIAESEVPRLLAELRPGLEWQEQRFPWVGVAPLTLRRLMRHVVIVSVLLTGIAVYFWQLWGALAGLVLFLLFTWLTIKKSRAIRFARTDWGVLYRSGMFTRKLSLAFYDRIQAIELSQSPFDRRWNMAKLRVDTAAAGPANHTIDAEYLDADYAAEQFRELHEVAAHHKPVWG